MNQTISSCGAIKITDTGDVGPLEQVVGEGFSEEMTFELKPGGEGAKLRTKSCEIWAEGTAASTD